MVQLVEVGIVLYTDAHLASVWGLTDLLKYASKYSENKQIDSIRVSHWQYRNGEIVKIWDTHNTQSNNINFIVIPPSFASPISQQDAKLYTSWLKCLHQNGAILCSICSGIFTLLETGILDGRTVTTHWLNNTMVRDRCPSIILDSNKIIVEETDLITTAGIMSWMDLGLKLVEKIYSAPFMIDFCKLLLVDPPAREQSFYKIFSPNFDHGDISIIKIQHWLQINYEQKITLDCLAEYVNLEKRTLLRRFKKATNLTIIEYCQNLRIQKAQDLLITTALSFDAISWQVGYKDSSSFRKIFIKNIGLSPSEYRKRF
ncbi:GlxA family transcriptional regulator [Acinetobacter sp. MB5]|uniref:GlxA family transcriptional regulator n=1 Tax=Acinetobacter sp. MB5 TaxID=2069438 RepID=UPI000DD08F5E|nr:helix-turn-helix domain-containing protein [Acinetobacter sp. MB5]